MSDKYTQSLPISVGMVASALFALFTSGLNPVGAVGELRENDFTLNYVQSTGNIPVLTTILYDSATNNLTTTITSRVGDPRFSTSTVSDEQEQNLVSILDRGNVLYANFNSNACSGSECGTAYLTLAVEKLNITNTLTWTKESTETLNSLFDLEEQLFSIKNTTNEKDMRSGNTEPPTE